MSNAYTELFDAFGDATRRSIVQLLDQRPHSVGELAERLPVSRPAVSQHVRHLREAGLVRVDTDGTRHVVSLDPKGLEALRNYLDALWRTSLAGLSDAAATAQEADRRPASRR